MIYLDTRALIKRYVIERGSPVAQKLDLSDAVYTLGFLFLGTAGPPAPFGACGADPTKDALECGGFPRCQ